MAKTQGPPKEIKQSEISEYVVLKKSSEGFKELKADLVDRLKRGASVEAGDLNITVNTDDGHSTSYKSVLDALVEAHPSLKKERDRLVRKHTKPKVSNEVVITSSSTP